jgi:hypothetical protein
VLRTEKMCEKPRSVAVDGRTGGHDSHGLRVGSPVVTDTGCCQSAAPTAPTSAFETQPESPAHIIRLPELNQVKRDYWAVFDDIEAEGEAAVAEACRRAKRFIAKWQPLYPVAVACVADHLDALVVHLLFPAEHRKRIRHSNLIERTFGETRRCVKVIGRLPGEQSCLSLVGAVLDWASKGWRGLTMTPKALRQLQDLRANSWPPTHSRRWSTSPSHLPPNLTPEPASRAVYTAPETPPKRTKPLPLRLCGPSLGGQPDCR